MLILIPVAFLLLINLLIFMPFFHLGLFGDDWLTIFRYFYYIQPPQHLGPYSTHYFNQFTYFINSYGPQDTIMALLYKSFGEQSNIYFIVSYILRLIAGLSIYFPSFYLTKNEIASWFAVFFFLFSATGLETSGWVFNMPSYLAITFFSLFLYFFLKSHEEKNIKSLVTSYFLFLLTFISTPIRAHGLIPFIISIELIWLISKRSLSAVKLSSMRIFGFLLIFLLIYSFGFRESISGPLSAGTISIGITSSLQLFSQHRFDFLFYPLVTLGSMIVPASFMPQGELTSLNQYLFNIFFPFFFICIILVLILRYSIQDLDRKFFATSSISLIIWGTLVYFTHKLNPGTLSSIESVLLLLIGGSFFILVLAMFIFLKANSFVKNGLLIALSWTIFSFLFPWWRSPDYLFLTTHRYLIISAVGLSLLLAKIVSLGKNRKSILILLIIGSIFLIMHTFSIRSYLTEQDKTHDRNTVKNIWSGMPYIPEVGKSREPLVFFFEGDGTNEAVLRDSVTFGFPPHMALLYKINEYELAPVPMDDWKEVESAVTDGKSLAKYYGGPQKPISAQRIYGFRLQGENLINITAQIRSKLTK